MRTLEELPIWQLSRVLNKELITILKSTDDFNTGYLKNHIFKTSGSVVNNIAEGFERSGNKELINFLSISKGGLGELKSQLDRAYDFCMIDENTLNHLLSKNNQISIQINQFILYLKRSEGSKFN
ncbi:MAG: s23 ribosomal protein [Crocinitomicaceae bacterium]|jgi:four helix bundle protein|nr:s23 ribosomal protein [Crocinitomicaceae bacterium]